MTRNKRVRYEWSFEELDPAGNVIDVFFGSSIWDLPILESFNAILIRKRFRLGMDAETLRVYFLKDEFAKFPTRFPGKNNFIPKRYLKQFEAFLDFLRENHKRDNPEWIAALESKEAFDKLSKLDKKKEPK